MNTQKDGGWAFPVPETIGTVVEHKGMSLREVSRGWHYRDCWRVLTSTAGEVNALD